MTERKMCIRDRAYTSVIPVRRLDLTVDYVQNKEKTTPKSLEEAVDYAATVSYTHLICALVVAS